MRSFKICPDLSRSFKMEDYLDRFHIQLKEAMVLLIVDASHVHQDLYPDLSCLLIFRNRGIFFHRMLLHDVLDHLLVLEDLFHLFQLDLSSFKIIFFCDFWSGDESTVAGIFGEAKPALRRLFFASLSVTMLLEIFCGLSSFRPNLGSAEGAGDKHVGEGDERIHLLLRERLVVSEVSVSSFEIWDVLVHAVDVSPEATMDMSVPSLLKLHPVGVEDDLHRVRWMHDDIFDEGLDSLVKASCEELHISFDNLIL